MSKHISLSQSVDGKQLIKEDKLEKKLSPALAALAGWYISGDVNGDSLVNIQDVVILVNMVLEVLDPDSCQIEFGDMNNDGINNILDVIQVVNLILDN